MINRDEAQNLLQDFLKIESITPNVSEAFDFLERIFVKYNFQVHRLKFKSDETYEVENMFATIGSSKPHFCFVGHADVVTPGKISDWSHQPFSGYIENNTIFSRGAEDMKGPLISSIVAGINYTQKYKDLNYRLSYLITGDEEGVAINGTKPTLEWLSNQSIKINDCIVTEPTSSEKLGDNIKIGRRGSLSLDLIIYGKQGHVAYPERASNPINPALSVLSDISGQIDEGTKKFLPTNIEVTSIDVNNRTHNLIPQSVRASFNIRFNDLWDEQSLMRYLRDKISHKLEINQISWELQKISFAESYDAPNEELCSLLMQTIFNRTKIQPSTNTLGGTSDARFVAKYCPVVEFGPVGRSMHQIDEKLPLDEFHLLTEIFEDFLFNYYSA